MFIGSNPKSELTKDVDIQAQMTQPPESGDTANSDILPQDSTATEHPKDMDPKRPSQEAEPLPSLPVGGKPETPSEQRFDLTKLNRAVASLLESEYPCLLHDHRFDNPKIRAEESPIKPGVLNILSLIDVCL